jgi:hypothetical protein
MPFWTIAYSGLSFIIPVFFYISHDYHHSSKQYSLKEIVVAYPIFISVYVIARVFLSFDYYMTLSFAHMLTSVSDTPLVPVVSQTILFILDTIFWKLMTSTSFMRKNSRMGVYSIATLLEAMFGLFLAMIIPVVAIGVIRLFHIG